MIERHAVIATIPEISTGPTAANRRLLAPG
jgi:hypothetical protein